MEPFTTTGGVSNVYLFNHCLEDAAPSPGHVLVTENEDPHAPLGIATYPGRALCLTDNADIIQLPSALQVEYERIIEHYARIGLRHTLEVLWDMDLVQAAQYPNHALSVFYFGDGAHRVRPNERWRDTAHAMNSKNAFIELCRRLGVRVPETRCFTSKAEVGTLSTLRYPVYLKTDRAASGLGVVRCGNAREVEDVLARVAEDVPFQLQREIELPYCINVQYLATNAELKRVAVTGQLLNGCAHSGNHYPVAYDVWELTDPLAHHLYQNGMQGVFAFDLAVDRQGVAYALECNPRYNGSSYPTVAAQKLGIGTWRAVTVPTRNRTLSALPLGDLEYSPHSGRGVVIVNWGCVLEGKLGVLVAGTCLEQNEIEQKLRAIL